MISELGRRMDEHTEKINKQLENTKKDQTELKYTVTEKFKNAPRGFNNR